MKKKLSVTVEEQTLKALEAHLAGGRFRNKSHLVEFALNRYLRNDE